MISNDNFCDTLQEHGVTFVAGVPCSYFSGPIERLTREGKYLPAANEGAALAAAAGASVAGRRSAVIAQNSGLGNLINPLTSLVQTYGIPVLVFMSLRGWPDPSEDEPQHAVMGTATHKLLDAVGVPHITVPADATELGSALDRAEEHLAARRSVFVLAQKGAIESHRPEAHPVVTGVSRVEVLRAIEPLLGDAAVVSTTGYTSRELFGVTGSKNHFYMQGSMGHAAAFALGVALQSTARPVVVLDGDGAAIMHLGTLSSVGACAPAGLVHLVFDNGTYESTGGQATTSHSTDFAGVARSVGYVSAQECRSVDEVTAALAKALRSSGPHLIVAKVAGGGTSTFSRATAAMTTDEIRDGFAARLETEHRSGEASLTNSHVDPSAPAVRPPGRDRP
ncbi:phosphonopyruvate decarboxylase [Streptomyces sp. CB01881]|uniref:phosphonopyruvate decarboxylase n=1 Tax=Streptomyces sp. CB01881 TaxID=2078691 RepID=UPI000CDC6559|nr:phosphonopyruvate decarboxylase [Streptomyces sp. CB01881]AUY53129.1 phosphonopyruvate decarboxylase [Streptomyces sp. CB01881]TYC69281.1 phosphonopyruvate decarboxylase [Streptomyces sp. CB01881]